MSFYSNYLKPLAVGAFLLTGLLACDREPDAAMSPGPVEVGVVTLGLEDVTLTTELPGRTTAFRKAEIRPQVNGIIVERLFEEGAEIVAGQQLYQIDDAVYKADYATALAGLAEAEANLTAARAQEERYKDLVAAKAVSQQDYDNALASFGQAKAGVAAAKAAVESARIKLQYTKVLAPISGRIGRSSVTEGALVTAGQAQPLAVIQQLDPIYVDMSQSADKLLDLRRQMLAGDLVMNTEPTVRLVLGDGSIYRAEGSLAFSEIYVDASTGTVTMRAVFPNPDHLLLPGMFVRAQVQEGAHRDAVLVPQKGITHNRQGNATALVVSRDGKIESRVLQTGRAVGKSWIVLSGVEPGEQVVVEGLQKVKPGIPVKAVPAMTPETPQVGQAPALSSDTAEG
jgi:membrane fusion protein (multidrug efflux system)